MTKKDYHLIAQAIYFAKAEGLSVADVLAERLEAINPRFDRKAFILASEGFYQ